MEELIKIIPISLTWVYRDSILDVTEMIPTGFPETPLTGSIGETYFQYLESPSI